MIHIETERLIFRDHEPHDLDDYLEMESDPEYRWPMKVFGRDALADHFRSHWLVSCPIQMQELATIYKPENRYIGHCGFHLYPEN